MKCTSEQSSKRFKAKVSMEEIYQKAPQNTLQDESYKSLNTFSCMWESQKRVATTFVHKNSKRKSLFLDQHVGQEHMGNNSIRWLVIKAKPVGFQSGQ